MDQSREHSPVDELDDESAWRGELEHDFFISYSPEDLDRARRIADILEGAGYTTFLTGRDLEPGQGWRPYAEGELQGSRVLLVLVTHAYVAGLGKSPLVAEAALRVATSLRLAIVPVRLDPTDAARLPAAVRSVQAIDLSALEPGDWAGPLLQATATAAFPPPGLSAAAPGLADLAIDPRLLADLPTDEDSLGFEPLVVGLDALLNDPRTQLPLSVAITAPWGGGKSSVMLQLRRHLERGGRGDRRRRWVTVSFDAWLYERRDELWAALAQAVYDQPQERMTRMQRLRFRLALERERLGGWSLAGKLVIPVIAALTAVIGAAVAINAPLLGSALGLGGAFVAVVGVWRVGVDAYVRSLRRYAKRPDYQATLGFTGAAKRDIDALVTVLTGRDRCLAVFVDDLDRLASAHVVEVIETINQIFNGQGKAHRCVFVLGYDREVVAASVDAAYEGTVGRLQTSNSPLARRFGFEFLSKLVQLSVAIPRPTDEAINGLLTRLDERRAADVAASAVPEPDMAVDAPMTPEGADAEPDGSSQTPGPTLQDSPDVREAQLEALRYVSSNPRQIKRFYNAFRLQLFVATRDPRNRLVFEKDQLIAIGKWIALRLRYPDLAEAIDADGRLLAALESVANGEPPNDENYVARAVDWLREAELQRVLNERDESRRISTIRFEGFLRIA